MEQLFILEGVTNQCGRYLLSLDVKIRYFMYIDEALGIIYPVYP